MNRKKTEKSLELELCFDETSNTWLIVSSGGHGIPASNFEITLWKEILTLRNQVASLNTRLYHLREMIAVINKECDEK